MAEKQDKLGYRDLIAQECGIINSPEKLRDALDAVVGCCSKFIKAENIRYWLEKALNNYPDTKV